MPLAFESNAPETQALLKWWHGLDDDRGARAELRRCHNLLAVMQTPAFHAARQQLIQAGASEATASSLRLAAVIALLSHLGESSDDSLPRAFSAGDPGDPPPVSPLRFRRILEAQDDEDFFRALRRVLPLVGKKLSPVRLANDVMHWGDSVRKRWVYDYRWPSKKSN